jgi:hypothetical protein
MNHEIIYTDEYALIVSDEIPDGFYYDTYLKDLRHTDCSEYGESSIAKKVIAHRPLTDVPIIEVVPLLPPFSWSQQYGVEKLAEDKYPISVGGSMWMPSSHDMMQANKQEGFIQGYNKAKETYKYTEEDIQKAFIAGEERIINKPNSSELDDFTNFIKSLQQPKRPKYFECEMEDYGQFDCGVFMKDGEEPKTITNSQGQTELVGEYIY